MKHNQYDNVDNGGWGWLNNILNHVQRLFITVAGWYGVVRLVRIYGHLLPIFLADNATLLGNDNGLW